MKDHQLDFEKSLYDLERHLAQLQKHASEHKIDLSEEIGAMEHKIEKTRRQIYSHLSVWQRVQLSRHPKRPHTDDYLGLICSEFWELHGDRLFQDDHAMIGGLATLKTDAGDTAFRTRSSSSASKRAGTRSKTCCATSACRTPRDTVKHSG